MDTILNQLWEIYNREELWHSFRLKEHEFKGVKRYLIEQKLLHVKQLNGQVIGYIEAFRVNYEQLGRLLCGQILYTYEENLTDGNIAYISNMWITEDYRGGETTLEMIREFTELYGNCDYVGMYRKHGLPCRVYSMKYKRHFNQTGV